MALACCDTSFLVSLYGSDSHSDRADAYVARLREPLTLSILNEFEFEQSLRFGVWRGVMNSAGVAEMQSDLRSDMASGRLVLAACDFAEVVAEARRLSATYTLRNGHRTFDILHVAVALHLGATNFLSFDTNQRKLAQAVGLNVGP